MYLLNTFVQSGLLVWGIAFDVLEANGKVLPSKLYLKHIWEAWVVQ